MKCAKFYKLSGFGPPPGVYVPIIISFIIGILTDPLPPDRDNVTIIGVFFKAFLLATIWFNLLPMLINTILFYTIKY